jgi:putative tricarboxylic transport membrane protein
LIGTFDKSCRIDCQDNRPSSPATYHLNPVSAIMLAGICYGCMYGSSTTSILLNIPGEPSSVITCLDGYQMARKGRAGLALSLSAVGSFVAGTVSVIGLVFLAPALAKFALRFGPPEYFSLMVMSLSIVTYLARISMLKGLMMACLGLIVGTVGMDHQRDAAVRLRRQEPLRH